MNRASLDRQPHDVADYPRGLAEMLLVTKPGGRLVVCEFNRTTHSAFRKVLTEYQMKALPSVARAVSLNTDSYVGLAESIQAWPDQRAWPPRSAAPAGGRWSGAT